MSTARDLALDQIKQGMKASFLQRISEDAVDQFSLLSGDFNPLHTDPQFAQAAGHPARVVHGALLAALASRLIGMLLPGRRSMLLSLKLDFASPSYPGDTIEVAGTVRSVHTAERVVDLKLTMSCRNEVRARGKALVLVRDFDNS